MAPGGKPSCLTTLPAVRHCQSQCEPTDSQTHLQSGGDLRCPDLGQSAWETVGSRSRRLRPDCMGTPSCMAFVVMGRRKRRPRCPIPYGGARSASALWTRVVDMDMVRPRKDPWGLSPRLRPWEAWGSLMDLCGRFRPVGLPRSSCDAYVGRVCHCHCGSDRRSWHPVRLVWVNGSFACRTIAARTQDLVLDTIPLITDNYSIIPVLP